MYNSFFLCTFAVGMQKRGIILLLVTTLLLSCSPKALREAEEVVAQADSMRAAGQMYADSVRLAQSYSTLRAWRAVRADEYAHACYHYGRLLREKDNPVEAMQCFIEASHSRTHDYHILGRVCSNMGDIAHLAGEFSLAYDMFRHAAKAFLQSTDTLSYNYAMNSSALELAEQNKIDETLVSLNAIDTSDERLSSFVNLSKAILYRNIERYDSAILFADAALKVLNEESGVMLVKAQAFYGLDMKDSALTYAKLVLSNHSATYQNTFNALYIISNIDSTLKKEEIRDLSSKREDIRYYEYEPDKDKSTIAVQLLQQDLTREPDLRWLIAIVGTLFVVSCIICIYVYRKRKRQVLLSQQIEQLKSEYTDLQIKKEKQLAQTCAILRASKKLQEDLCWKDFEQMCVVVNKHFYMLANKLRQKDVLNETEIRLCILVLLGLSRIEIASMLPYALSGVGKLKDHTAKLLGTTGRNLHDFLINITVEG